MPRYMSSTSPQEDADAYLKMASIIQTTFDELLKPLEKTRDPERLLESTTAEEF